ncbi:MAG: hypothetical protein GY754_42180 [bacterium]|nr:hypothetical protein [bacterium]
MKYFFGLGALISLMICQLCFSSIVSAQEEETAAAEEPAKIGLSAGLTYSSLHFWRGYDVYGGQGAFFPTVSVSLFDTGVSLGFLAELPDYDGATDGNKVNYAADFYAAYSYTVKDLFSFGANGWFIWKINSKDENQKSIGKSYDNSFAILTAWFQLDSIILKPKISYSHDIHIDDRDGDRDTYKDFYIRLDMGHTFKLHDICSLSFGAGAGYFNSAVVKSKSTAGDVTKSGISDITVNSSFAVSLKGTALSASLNCAILPDEDWYNNGTYNVYHKIWGTIAASHSF